jgi:transcriptional regulator with XRE-family HTH domain
MTKRGRNRYDEDLLVRLLAEGRLPQSQIARRAGLSAAMVGRIASGASRPDLHERIRNYNAYRDAEALQVGKGFIRPLLMTQLKVAMEPKGETSRKAREFLLNRLLFAPTKHTQQDADSAPMPYPLEEIPGLEKKDIESFYAFKASAEKIVGVSGEDQRR